MCSPQYKYYEILTRILRNFESLIKSHEDISYCTNQIQKAVISIITEDKQFCYNYLTKVEKKYDFSVAKYPVSFPTTIINRVS